ncbi:MAG: TlpA disulfide reductase family protein [Myxococcota bacterium]
MSGCGAARSARLGLGLPLGLGLLVALSTLATLAPAAVAGEAALGLRAPACELTPLVAEAAAPAVRPASFVRSFEGRITLVDFWASWCPTCEHGFSYLNALARDYHAAGLDVVAVNLDADLRDAQAFLAGRRVEFELARDETGRCPRGFGLVGMPQAFLVDASGRVQAVTRGFRAGDARALRDRIEALLEGAPAALPAVASGPAAVDGDPRRTDRGTAPRADASRENAAAAPR